MAGNYTAKVEITTQRGDVLSASKTGSYNETFNVRQVVDNSDGFINLVSMASAKAAATLADVKAIIIKNSGNVGAEIQLKNYTSTHAAPDTVGALAYQSMLLGAGEYVFLSNLNFVDASNDNSSANGKSLTDAPPYAAGYIALDNAAGGDAQLLNEASNINATVTEIDVDEGGYFFIGDLLRIEDEIVEITGISTNALTVIRGVHGSSAATHNDDVALRLPFYNAYYDFDRVLSGSSQLIQTDGLGRFKAHNFFGYGRNTDGSNNKESSGIVAGSVSGKFYSSAYQEIPLGGTTSVLSVNAQTESKLTASTAYAFNLTIDDSSATTVSFTTDSSNTKIGGSNGVMQKIQEAIDTATRTAGGGLYGHSATLSIVGGAIRLTSNSHLSPHDGTNGSKILFADAGSGTNVFSGSAGIFPAIAAVTAPVVPQLPQDTILDPKTGLEVQNISEMFYDDGFGNLHGKCTGTINYTTGAITLAGAPANAEFVVSANYGSTHAGGNRFGADEGNCIQSIAARSANQKIDTTIEVIGLN
tara:strand:- start:581 stop:2170 length:1590 start_codon:yes stop_codon:yes gene_type:complete